MRYLRFKHFVSVMALAASSGCVVALAQTHFGVGTPATQEDIGDYGFSSGPTGKGLPPGKGTAKEGQAIYMVKCSMCHGQDLQGNPGTPGAFSPLMGRPLAGANSVPHYRMAPGQRSNYVWTMGSATAVFNVIAVEMPFYRPGTLTAEEIYKLSAFILFKNGLIKEDQVMDRETLPKVQMPNRNNAPGLNDEIYLDMNKRGCFKTYGECRDP
jgi:mono/diheme cytochrome c family protein